MLGTITTIVIAMLVRITTGIATLGVLPYLDLSRLPAEDAVDWDKHAQKTNDETLIDVAVMRDRVESPW